MRRKTLSYVVIGLIAPAMIAAFVWMTWHVGDARTESDQVDQHVPIRQGEPSVDIDPAAARGRSHPLLKDSEEAVLTEGDAAGSTAGPRQSEVIRAVIQSGRDDTELPPLAIDYPVAESVFPPEMVAPTFLWHEPIEQADTWLIDVAFRDDPQHLYALSPGNPPPVGKIDPRCLAPTNEVYQPTPYQASAKSWAPSAAVWAAIKQRSSGRAAIVTIQGFKSGGPWEPVSRGRMTITTSLDPVGAPIFYRDVPLAPSRSKKGKIMPLGQAALKLINWRLRDISKPESRLVLTDMPTCANCHSFSADGTTLGMDLDGPLGEKGTYVITPTAKQTVIPEKDVITWNSFQDKPKDHKTIGFMSRISPAGEYAITTVNEALYVRNFLQYKFLQVFYPTRGILAYYSRSTGEMKALPGADDPSFVHCNPVWSPDGEYIVFARAEAKDPYPEGAEVPTRANDPAETQIQYDLYRVPFSGGQGGEPEPIAGASDNGMSNAFPKISPDGKWIVFVKCRNGQLMRPDSMLWIVPATGGSARQMHCNTSLMNSWHSFSPNSRWLVFSSKANTPYTQMFLTHIDEDGNDTPPILIPNSTAANRAVNLPEFVNIPYDGFVNIDVPHLDYMKDNDRGIELAGKGKLTEALALFDKVLASRPEFWKAHINAGVALLENGRLDEATDRFNKALQLNAKSSDAHANLGAVLLQKDQLDEAMTHLGEAIKLEPDHMDAQANMATVLWRKGKLEEATVHFRAALRFNPEDARTQFELGTVLSERGMHKEAVTHLRKSLEIDPNNLPAINELAWLLAVCPQDDVRRGPESLQLAQRACAASGFRDPVPMGTLAAAYAELGRYSEAVSVATSALRLVRTRDEFPAPRLRQQLEQYKKNEPYRWRPGG